MIYVVFCIVRWRGMDDLVELKRPIAQLYMEVLGELGYSTSIDSDGDVEFKVDDVDLNYCAVIDEDHHKFVRISCLLFYKFSSRDNKDSIYQACNVANLETKVAKTFVQRSGRSVSTSYECFVEELNKDSIRWAIKSGVATTRAAMKNFAEALDKSS